MSSQFKPMIAQKNWESLFPSCEVLIAAPEKESGINSSELELSLTLDKISQLLSRGVAAEKIAVLSRTNRRLEELGALAKLRGISYQQPNAAGYFLKREIKDAASILKFLLNPHDNDHLVTCLRSPWFYLDDGDLISACQKKSNSLWKTLLLMRNTKSFAQEASSAMMDVLESYLMQARMNGISQTLLEILIQRGLLDVSENIDPSGRREANLWKFINTLKEKERFGGFHYIDFLNEVESLVKSEDEGEAAPVIEPQRVNFMTIHASKGLQFDHLILLGLSQDQKRSSSLLWSFNEKRQSWSLALRAEEDQSWIYSPQTREQTLIQQEKESLESERVLYVAMTRAKESITLVMDEKIRKQSWAQKLFLNLSEGEHKTETYQYIVKKIKNFPEVQDTQEKNKLSFTDQLPKKFVNETFDEVKSSSVTSLLDSVVRAQIPSMDAFEVIKKSQFGTDLHRVFESLKYLSFEEVSKLYKNENIQETLNYLKSLDAPPLMQLMSVGHVEYGFEVLQDSAVTRGQIDLWGKIGNHVWIVDYKTGSTLYSEKAFQQLGIYAGALRKIHRWNKDIHIELNVLYPLEKQVFSRVLSEGVE